MEGRTQSSCDLDLLINDHLRSTRTKICCLLPSPHGTDSLFNAASPNFQGLVDTLHFLALLLLPVGLLVPQGLGCFLLHLLHFQQLQEELEKLQRVRKKLRETSTKWLSRTLPRYMSP